MRVERIGDWPKLEFINDQDRIVEAVLARSPLGGSQRQNLHSFEATVTPAINPSWRHAVDGFLSFIAFEPAWRDQAEGFLEAIPSHYDVQLNAFDKKHLFYAIHQARSHRDTMLSYFAITVFAAGELVTLMVGHYDWDGRTCPDNAKTAIEAVYADVGWAIRSIWSSVDRERYEGALSLHGFAPKVDVYVSQDDFDERGFRPDTVRAFVDAYPGYARDVSGVLETQGPLPTDPRGVTTAS